MNRNIPNWINKDLEKSGLAPENFHIEELNDILELRARLGFSALPDISGNRVKLIEHGGYWILYPNAPNYYRLKLRSPINTKNGTIKYLSPKMEIGHGNKPYILHEVEKLVETYKPDKPIFITEGEKKAAKATLEGFHCIGLSGVWNFKDSENEFLPELHGLNLRYRRCYIVFDSDIFHKVEVQRAELRLAVELINRGSIPLSIRLPNEEDGEKNGLDDYLVRYGKEAFGELVEKAEQTIKLLIEEGKNINLILKEIARLKSASEKEKYIHLLSEREGVSKTAIKKDLQSVEILANKKPEKKVYKAVFENLVDIVDHEGEMVYLVKEGGNLTIKNSVEINGGIYYPPPREKLPFSCIPRVGEVIKHYESDEDSKLYSDLIEYHTSISELPSPVHYDLLTSWDFLTYLIDSVQYLPYIWLYAIPERGKSRTGKGCIFVAYRGIHVESLREAYLLRASNDLHATIFFDVMNLSKKAEKSGSDDILLQRFEKGLKVPRVLFPDRGAHQDTVYYDIYGSTIIATNEPVHEILETRALMISMPESSKIYENDVRPEDGLQFKERLLAFRARHLGEKLPDVEKPAKGRLGDIIRPLLQIIMLVNPDRVSAFSDLIRGIEQERKEHSSESLEARLVKAIVDLEYRVDDGLLSIKSITERANEEVKEKYHSTPKSVGWKLNALGFQKRKRSDGSHIQWDESLIEMLKDRYGLGAKNIGDGCGEMKHNQRQEYHSTNVEQGPKSDVSDDVYVPIVKKSRKRSWRKTP